MRHVRAAHYSHRYFDSFQTFSIKHPPPVVQPSIYPYGIFNSPRARARARAQTTASEGQRDGNRAF